MRVSAAILEIIVAGHRAHAWICQIAIEEVEALVAIVRNVRRRAVISIDMVCRRFANDAVGSRFSIHPIGAGSGVQVIVAVAAKHVVCAAAAVKRIDAVVAKHDVGTGPAEQHVAAAAPVQIIVAHAADKQIAAGASKEGVVPSAAISDQHHAGLIIDVIVAAVACKDNFCHGRGIESFN